MFLDTQVWSHFQMTRRLASSAQYAQRGKTTSHKALMWQVLPSTCEQGRVACSVPQSCLDHCRRQSYMLIIGSALQRSRYFSIQSSSSLSDSESVFLCGGLDIAACTGCYAIISSLRMPAFNTHTSTLSALVSLYFSMPVVKVCLNFSMQAVSSSEISNYPIQMA